MPIHDWTKVNAGTFHHFHQSWIQFNPDKPLTLASYVGGEMMEAYVEPTAIGQTLIDMPLFLNPRRYVPVPLEKTYQSAWEAVPAVWRKRIAT